MHTGKYSPESLEFASLALVTDLDPVSNLNWVTAFEEKFAHFVGAKYAIAVNSGTSGLHSALLAAGVSQGDEVISPALTVIMDAFSTIYTGATPVFADVDPNTWNIDPKAVEKLITTRTKAVIAVSWFGLVSNLDELRKICDRYNLFLIDDSAELISLQRKQFAALGRPDARVFSFESKKHMSTGGEGGMVTTDHEELAVRIRKSAGLGYKHLSAGRGRTSLAAKIFQHPSYERFDSLGLNYRMTPINAAIGLGQMMNLDSLLKSRIFAASTFLNAIEGCTWLITQPLQQDGINHTFYTFGVKYLGDQLKGVSWESFYDQFVALGGHGFYSNCKNPYLEPFFSTQEAGSQKWATGLCPIAEDLQLRIMAFKTNYLDPEIVKSQAEKLASLVDRIGRR
jgi:perosamine synthetase